MNRITLATDAFLAEFCPFTGAMVRLSHRGDEHAMNWLVTAEESPWHPISADWGLGFLSRPHRKVWRWQKAAQIQAGDDGLTVGYEVDEFRVTVRRQFDALGRLTERYVFRNVSDRELKIGSLGIYAPFNDNYPSAGVCLTRRCSAHVWAGDDVAWANCIRMGGRGPHLGVALTEGYLAGYGIEHRDTRSSSNIRGDIVLLAADAVCESPEVIQRPISFAPGGEFAIGWTFFWHQGWDDFFDRLVQLGLPAVEADRYVALAGQPVKLSIRGGGPAEPVAVELGGKKAVLEQQGQDHKVWTVSLAEQGLQTIDIRLADGRHTYVKTLAVADPMKLVEDRVRFIVAKQQVNDPADPLDGALLPYDNEVQALLRSEISDRNEARERVGMGVLLAEYLCRNPDNEAVRSSLTRYCRFVKQHLQNESGSVYDSADNKRQRRRMYNYPWVAHLWLRMYRLTGRQGFAEDFFRTMSAYYADGGDRFYAFGIRVLEGLEALATAGLANQREALLADFSRHAEMIRSNGVNYPSHEVNYEQSIVAPAATLLLEMALATGDRSYLQAAREHMQCLEAFNGRQNDFRLHDIAIRHWDGYWFGKCRTWGDTMPHYWSVLTAIAFDRYWRLTGQESYRQRARAIALANLAAFDAAGRASCALIHPISVDGRGGRFADPYANDQDWALVYYLDLLRPHEPGGA